MVRKFKKDIMLIHEYSFLKKEKLFKLTTKLQSLEQVNTISRNTELVFMLTKLIVNVNLSNLSINKGIQLLIQNNLLAYII